MSIKNKHLRASLFAEPYKSIICQNRLHISDVIIAVLSWPVFKHKYKYAQI